MTQRFEYLLRIVFLAIVAGIFVLILQSGSTATEVVGLVRQDCTGYTNCYASLQAWENAYGGIDFGACLPGDLICSDKIAIAQIDGPWNNAITATDGSGLTISGWKTGANNYIKIYTTAAARHAGKWDATKFRITSTNYFQTIDIATNHVILDGLQIENARIDTGSSSANGVKWTTASSSVVARVQITNSIIKKTNPYVTSGNIGVNSDANNNGTGKKMVLANNVIYGFSRGVDYTTKINDEFVAYNNTVYDARNYAFSFSPWADGDILRLKNNLVASSSAAYAQVSQSSWTTFDTASNISPDASSPNSAFRNKTVSFINVAGENFHLVFGDANAWNTGSILTSDASFPLSGDIDGDARTSAWDIGADESMSTDSAPPSIPTGLTATPLSASQINLFWNASTDDSGVIGGYNLYRNGSSLGNLPSSPTTYSDTGLTEGTAYTYTVSAYDANNNFSAQSTPVIATTTVVDTQAPSVPTGISATALSATQISISWNSSTDNVIVAGYKIYS